MKLIIAGGRNYQLTAEDRHGFDRITISEVVSGGATGADVESKGVAGETVPGRLEDTREGRRLYAKPGNG